MSFVVFLFINCAFVKHMRFWWETPDVALWRCTPCTSDVGYSLSRFNFFLIAHFFWCCGQSLKQVQYLRLFFAQCFVVLLLCLASPNQSTSISFLPNHCPLSFIDNNMTYNTTMLTSSNLILFFLFCQHLPDLTFNSNRIAISISVHSSAMWGMTCFPEYSGVKQGGCEQTNFRILELSAHI